MRTYIGLLVTSVALLFSSKVFAQGVWLSDSSADFVPRYNFESGAVNGKIIVVGDFEGSGPIQSFDPSTHTWENPVFAGNDSLITQATSCTVGNKILIIGGISNGENNQQLIVVDPVFRTVTRPSMIGHYISRVDACCALVDNRIYLFGGADNTHIVDTVEMFDVTTFTWSVIKTTGRFSPERAMSATTVNGKIYLVGGQDAQYQLSDTVQVFDPATNSFAQLKPNGTFTARSSHAAGVINGKIYVVGGGSSAFPLEWTHPTDTTELQIYDPSTNAWSTPRPGGHFTSRSSLRAEVIGGKLYTLGGYRPHGSTNYVEVYDPNGTDEVDQASSQGPMTVWPNPATEDVTISNIPSANMTTLEVFDQLGRCVATSSISGGVTTTHLDVSSYAAGVYTIRSGMAALRFVKE